MYLFVLFVHFFIYLVSISSICCVFNFTGVLFFYLFALVKHHHAVPFPQQDDLQRSSGHREESKGQHHRSGEAGHLGQEG